MKNFFNNAINLESLSILFSQAPVGLAMLMGEDHVVLNANVLCLEFWQKGSEVIGLPILEALPEIANQEFPKILREVYQTGTTFKGSKIKTLIEKVFCRLTISILYIPRYLIQKKLQEFRSSQSMLRNRFLLSLN